MTRYNLVFQGHILEEASLDEVKNNLGHLFKADEKKIDHLFSGKPVIIKKNLDSATAEKYLSVLKKAGAKVKAVKIIADATVATNNVAESTQQETPLQGTENSAHSASSLSSTAESHDTVLTLAEANTGVLPTSPGKAAVEVPDISHLSMSPPQSGSLEEFAEIIAPAVIPNTEHISLAAPNTGSLEEFIQPVEAVELPDISAIKLAEQDGQELSAESKKPVPVEIPHTSELRLSEAGKGSMEGLSKKAEAEKTPDTSHLQLEPKQNSRQNQGKAIFKID